MNKSEKMDFETFKCKVVSEVKNYLPPDFAKLDILVYPVQKVNGAYTGMVFKRDESNISPTIYLEQMFESYLACGHIEEVLSDIANTIIMSNQKPIDYIDFGDFEQMKKRIVFQLINTEKNEELLKDIPKRAFHDLSIIYRIDVSKSLDLSMSAIVKNGIMDIWKVSEEELYSFAIDNTLNNLKPCVNSMKAILQNIMPENEMFWAELESDIYVISNEYNLYGASSVLYDNILFQIASKLDSDIYLLPSSIHEMIVIKAIQGVSAYGLAEMVKEVNSTQLPKEEILSDKVYIYSRKERRISIAIR